MGGINNSCASAHQAQLACDLGIFSTLFFEVFFADNWYRQEWWSRKMYALSLANQCWLIKGYLEELLHSQCYQSGVSSSGGCSFSSFCCFYSSSLFAAFVHTAELELRLFRLGTVMFVRVPGSVVSNSSAALNAAHVWLRKSCVWHLSGNLPPFSLQHLALCWLSAGHSSWAKYHQIFTVLSATNEVLSWKKRGWQPALRLSDSKVKKERS